MLKYFIAIYTSECPVRLLNGNCYRKCLQQDEKRSVFPNNFFLLWLFRKAVGEATDPMLKGISVYVAQDCTGMEYLNVHFYLQNNIKKMSRILA